MYEQFDYANVTSPEIVADTSEDESSENEDE